jgi:hypothetical protein
MIEMPCVSPIRNSRSNALMTDATVGKNGEATEIAAICQSIRNAASDAIDKATDLQRLAEAHDRRVDVLMGM